MGPLERGGFYMLVNSFHFHEVSKCALLSDHAFLVIIEKKTSHTPADGDQAGGSRVVGSPHKTQEAKE